MIRKQPLKEYLGANVFAATGITTKLPEIQTIKDKQHQADANAKYIAEMKELLFTEIGYQKLSEKRIAEIRSVLKPKNKVKSKEDLDTMLNDLLKSRKISARAKRIAQIILDREEARKRALADKELFEKYENRSKEAMAQMRRNYEMIQNTGRQGR